VVVGLALLGIAIAVMLGDVDTELSPHAVRERLLSWGVWGPVFFVVAFALLQPFGFAAHVFIVGASLVWSPWQGALLSWLGIMASSAIAFAFARWMGRSWVQRRLPQKLRRWDGALATRGFRTVLVMRLLLFTFGPMQLMLGVSNVRFAAYMAATAVGVVPMLLLESYGGATLVSWLFG
jgi:uncharacterized membrane protein YdjX (TVP38/TMEM64 family)